jgi:SAM-dependent methyltransferase
MTGQLPEPWAESDHLPWDDPGFSERMLKEHLSQKHDAASRRFEIVDRQVCWIHEALLGGNPSRILDLGCGPGLYLQRLAALGHDCHGIDFSPASIAYAKDTARRARLAIQYLQEDVRKTDFGRGFDLVMMIWGEFNVFPPQDAEALLLKCASALRAGGKLLLEPHTFESVRKRGQEPASQYSSESGLFLDSPHICVRENFWHASCRAATTRWTVTDSTTRETVAHSASYQAYTDQEYEDLLTHSGFTTVHRHPSLTGRTEDRLEDVIVLVAQK